MKCELVAKSVGQVCFYSTAIFIYSRVRINNRLNSLLRGFKNNKLTELSTVIKPY